ncbi:MAG: DUF4175 family protein [Planctomyces sp.]|jgi:hypothetical protein
MSTIADKPVESTPPRSLSPRASVRVTAELESLFRQLRRLLWIRGICLSGGIALFVLLVLTIVDAIVQPQSALARFVLCLAGLTLFAEAIRRSLWKPLHEHRSRLQLAWSLEQLHPQFEERLTSTLQLSTRHETTSAAFVEAIATQAQSGMAACSAENLAGRSLRNAMLSAAICVVALAIALLVNPERLLPSLANVLCPWHARVLPRLAARVQPGDAEVAEGQDLEIKVTGLNENDAVVQILADADTSESDMVSESHAMVIDVPKHEASFLLQQIEKSLTYRVRSSGLYSDSFRITVNPAPVITGLQATTTFPEYTQLPPASVNLLTGGTPSAANAVVPMMPALLGARVTVTGTANLPISEAELMRDATAVKSKPAANAAQYSWEFEVGAVPADAESMVQECNVRLISDRQVPSETARFEIHVSRDLPPEVEIRGLNTDTLTVRPDQLLEIPFSAVDDFGIQKLELAIRRDAQEPSLAIIPAAQPDESDADFSIRQRDGSTTLDIAALNVKPGEALSVWLKVGDNRTEPLGGSQSSDSRIITLQIAEDATPVGQQAVQQQHENAEKELVTAIEHLKTAQLKAERLSQSLPDAGKVSGENPAPAAVTSQTADPAPAPAGRPSEPSEKSPATPDSEAPTDPVSADKAASEVREQIQSAQQALQRMQDKAREQPSPLFQPEMKQAQEVSEQELKKAEQQSSLIPLADELQQKQEAVEATRKELQQAIQKLEQIQSDISKRSKDMELAAQLDELAKQQETLARRMKEDQTPQDPSATRKDPSKNVLQQKQQKDIADALQKLAASDEDARSELFKKRAEEASRLAEETQRLQQQQERLNRLNDSQDQPEQKRDEQLMEMIAEEQAQQAADTLNKSQPEDVSDEATGRKSEAPTLGNDSNADEKTESSRKQQERVRQAIQAVRENRPEDAAAKLQEQIAERTEQIRHEAEELLQRPTDDEENREAMKAAEEKLRQAAEQTKAAAEPPQPKGQQPQHQQSSQATKALDEAAQALQNVCKSCQNCSQCNKPGSSAGASGKSGNSNNQADPSERNAGAPKEGGAAEEGGTPQDNGEKKQLAKVAEMATETAKKSTPEGANELSRDLSQLADQAAKKSQFPGRKAKDSDSKQADKDGKPGSDGATKSAEQSPAKDSANGKTGGKSNRPDGATGNAQSSDQLDSPQQLRGPSTSSWTRSRRMLNGSVLDDRDVKVPQEYRGVVEDYFEQLSRIESVETNTGRKSADGKTKDDQENQP